MSCLMLVDIEFCMPFHLDDIKNVITRSIFLYDNKLSNCQYYS